MKLLFLLIMPLFAMSNDYWEISKKTLSKMSDHEMLSKTQTESYIIDSLNLAKEYELKETLFLKTLKDNIEEEIKSIKSSDIKNNLYFGRSLKGSIVFMIATLLMLRKTLICVKNQPYNRDHIDFGTITLGLAALCFQTAINAKFLSDEIKQNEKRITKFTVAKEVIEQLL